MFPFAHDFVQRCDTVFRLILPCANDGKSFPPDGIMGWQEVESGWVRTEKPNPHLSGDDFAF